ncbi:MAG: hypothetical protein HFF17_00455 [Oscillospiraceae bacterium]|nr:hypothetical protein [Oscillospiraceae bacterium]
MKLLKKPVSRSTKSKQQNIQNSKKVTPSTACRKMTNTERVLWENMNQIEWFPIDPYAD